MKMTEQKMLIHILMILHKMTMVQDSLFRTIYNDVQNNMLDVSKPNDNESIYEVTTTSTNDTVCLLS